MSYADNIRMHYMETLTSDCVHDTDWWLKAIAQGEFSHADIAHLVAERDHLRYCNTSIYSKISEWLTVNSEYRANNGSQKQS